MPSSSEPDHTLNSKPKPTLLGLPAELRNHIYALILVKDFTLNVRKSDSPDLHQHAALTRVNKQLRRETLPTYYTSNTFLLADSLPPPGYKAWSDSIAPHVHWLRNLHVSVRCRTADREVYTCAVCLDTAADDEGKNKTRFSIQHSCWFDGDADCDLLEFEAAMRSVVEEGGNKLNAEGYGQVLDWAAQCDMPASCFCACGCLGVEGDCVLDALEEEEAEMRRGVEDARLMRSFGMEAAPARFIWM